MQFCLAASCKVVLEHIAEFLEVEPRAFQRGKEELGAVFMQNIQLDLEV